MIKYRFSVEKAYVGGLTDVARVREDEDALTEIVQTAFDDMKTDIMLKVGGVTMFLAAWEDPDHWSEEWREKAGDEDVGEFIASLLASAVEPGD